MFEEGEVELDETGRLQVVSALSVVCNKLGFRRKTAFYLRAAAFRQVGCK